MFSIFRSNAPSYEKILQRRQIHQISLLPHKTFLGLLRYIDQLHLAGFDYNHQYPGQCNTNLAVVVLSTQASYFRTQHREVFRCVEVDQKNLLCPIASAELRHSLPPVAASRPPAFLRARHSPDRHVPVERLRDLAVRRRVLFEPSRAGRISGRSRGENVLVSTDMSQLEPFSVPSESEEAFNSLF